MKGFAGKICAVFFCALLFLGGCAPRNEVREGDSFLYCLNADRTGLVKIRYEIQGEELKKTIEQVLEELQTPSGEIDYTAPIPKEIQVSSWELKDGILDLCFSMGYLDLDPVEEKLVRAAVVQSLVQIQGVNAVAFNIEGAPLKNREGRRVGFMNEDDFVENTGSSPSSYQTGTLLLFFANETGDALVTQKMDVKYSSNVSKEKLIVEKLMQGPKGSDAYPLINPDANLLSVTIKDEICYVNFDSTFLTSAYDVLPELTIYSIVNSLVMGTDATQVQITINGESKAKYMETVDLSKPLEQNLDWVAVDEKE